MSRPLDAAERAGLLRLARASLAERLLGDGSLERELARTERTEGLRSERGVFVTLRVPGAKGGLALRGCIGNMRPQAPLFRTVVDVARKSAFEDPRFAALAADELPRVHIEISVLTEMRPVAGPEQIDPGRHGVQLRRAGASAVFLPQVAREHGWDRETLLRQLARKAGLGDDAWRAAEFSVFEAEAFAEGGAEG